MTKFKSNTSKEFNTKWITDWEYTVFFFFFLHLIKFLKAPTNLEFPISTIRLFYSFMQYGKKVFLKDFVLYKEGLITEAYTDLKE